MSDNCAVLDAAGGGGAMNRPAIRRERGRTT